MAAAKNPDKQVMDVSKPGKVPASSSSRPIIVGHGPMVQDPMVTSQEETKPEPATTEEAEVKSPAASKRVIAPITKDEESAETQAEPTAAADATEPTEEVTETEASDNTTENESSEAPSDAAVVDSVVDQVDIGSKREAEQQAEEERKKQEAIDKLVADKKYFVPIGKTHKRAGKGITIFTLFLLVVFLGLIAAIDAEILEVSFSLPFDLIK